MREVICILILSIIKLYRELGICYFKTEKKGNIFNRKKFYNFILKMQHDYVGKDM